MSPFTACWRRCSAIAAGIMLAGTVQAEPAPERMAALAPQPWVVVQPAFSEGFQFDTAQALSQELSRLWGQPVHIDAATRGQGAQAIAWSVAVAEQQPSILVLPEESVLIGEGGQHHPTHISNLSVLLVLGYKRWCVFTHARSPLQHAQQLQSWAQQVIRPVRIALPNAAGRMQLWVKGMAQMMQHPWEVQVYGINGNFAEALEHGADLAMARCDRVGGTGSQDASLRVLVQSGAVRAPGQQAVPTFVEAGWLPFEHGWSAVFAPQSIAQAQREHMAQALRQAVNGPLMQQGLRRANFVPANLSPSASQAYMDSFVRAWGLVGHFLLGPGFGSPS